jgi:hypothetical protein
MATFKGYEPRTIPTADVKIGDRMYAPGAGFLLPVVSIVPGEKILFKLGPWEAYGRRRFSHITRSATGRSTIHVPIPAPEPTTPRACDCGASHRVPRERPHDPHCGTVTYV